MISCPPFPLRDR